jgi:protease II
VYTARKRGKTDPSSFVDGIRILWTVVESSLLDRGFVLAYAHTRGGGELGNSWHHRGNLLDKPVRLVAKAFSAGCVVVGAAVNRRPDLFLAVVLTTLF